jgi:hypothetical protein
MGSGPAINRRRDGFDDSDGAARHRASAWHRAQGQDFAALAAERQRGAGAAEAEGVMSLAGLSARAALVLVRDGMTEADIARERGSSRVKQMQAALVTLLQGDLSDCDPAYCETCKAAMDLIERIKRERR